MPSGVEKLDCHSQNVALLSVTGFKRMVATYPRSGIGVSNQHASGSGKRVGMSAKIDALVI